MSGGVFKAGNEWAAPGSAFDSNGAIKGYPYDPEKAKELLKEAGYADGCNIKYYGNASIARDNIIVGYLEEVGFKVEFTPRTIDNLVVNSTDPISGCDVQGLSYNWSANGNGQWFSENPVFYQDRWPEQKDKIVELYNEALSADNFEEASTSVIELEKYVIDENCLLVPIVVYSPIFLWRNYVEDAGLDSGFVYAWTPEVIHVNK